MVYEFALDPALVATWHDRRVGRLFKNSFGLGTPRVIAPFPKRQWQKMALDIASRDGDIARTRLEALLQSLTEVISNRARATYNSAQGWRENASLS
jgi:hypothetical protein